MSVSIHDPRTTPRHIADQLRRFLLVDDAPQPASRNAISLSDAGFALLGLKDQIHVDNSRSQHFCQEFIARPLNGIELLSRVLSVLQGIINSNQTSSSKISNLLSRSNTNNRNRKRKAAAAEADCIECLKILLEKSENAWRRFLDLTTGMDAVLFAVNSPQLDSKCYAVEILLLLLDKHQGFVVLMRALTAMTARSRDYIRLTLFVSQLKHGLHTQKLHIQILIVRLFNKLLATAPSSLHRSLIRSEIMLSRFSAEYVENLITTQSAPLGGMDILANELDLWRSLGSSTTPSYSFEQSRIYGLSEVENDSSQGGRSRNSRPPSSKYPIASTTVTKNVERHRFKKQSGVVSGERSSTVGHYPEVDRNTSSSFYADRRSLTLSNRVWQETPNSPLLSRGSYTTERRTPSGMRRAKSESAMIGPEKNDSADSLPRRLKRCTNYEQQIYHPIEHTKAISKSVHDVSVRGEAPTAVFQRPSSTRPSSAHSQSRKLRSGTSSPVFSPENHEARIRLNRSPPRAHYTNPISPRTRFAEPVIVEAQIPHAGFSYLFPSQPVVASFVSKRTLTPDHHHRQSSVRTQSPPRAMLPSPAARPDFDSSCYGRNDEGFYATDSRTSSRAKVLSPSINGGIGDDVRDALSQFDYLNDYENSSLRERGREASYHF